MDLGCLGVTLWFRTGGRVRMFMVGPDTNFHANIHLHDQVCLHQIDTLSVDSSVNREADVIDVRCEIDDSLPGADRNLPSNHLVAAMAGPDVGAISVR